MSIVLSHISAVEFWRSPWGVDALRAHRANKVAWPLDVRSTAGEAEALKERIPWLSSGPVHVLAPSANARCRNRMAESHTCTQPLPSGSLIEIGEGLFVCSPELCIVQMATELSFPKYVELGFEFCGSYRLAKTGFAKSMPLTSVKEIERYIANAGGTKGTGPAAKAMRFVVDESVSPMETVVVVILCFPVSRGGYGLPIPLMNHRINVPASARRLTSKKYYVCDAYWPGARLDVEYDSDLWHTKRSDIARDSARRNALSAMGVAVRTITWEQVKDCVAMNEAASSIARKLGVRLRLGRISDSMQQELRRELLAFAVSRDHRS